MVRDRTVISTWPSEPREYLAVRRPDQWKLNPIPRPPAPATQTSIKDRPWGRVSVKRGDGVGAGARVGVYLFLKECCFKVRVRERVDTNPQPNPNPNVERREEM